MRLKVFHRTRYRYRVPVRDSYNELRLRPAADDPARLEFFLLNVQPPSRLRHFRDRWQNFVHYFDLPEPHSELTIEAQSIINTSNTYEGRDPVGGTFDELATLQDEMLAPFAGSSQYVTVDPACWREAIDVRDNRTDVFETALAVMRHVNRAWTYAPNTTLSSTHMREVMEKRRGVCQDFAHVMIGFCRALGIPTRYASGYLHGSVDLRGAQASHAWCEVFVPGRGWLGLDPTNDTPTGERHIKIATGRDYQDAAPIRGHFGGPPGATQALDVELEVRPV